MPDCSPKFTLLSERKISSHPCQPLVSSEFKFLGIWVGGLGSVHFSVDVLCLALGIPRTTSHCLSARSTALETHNPLLCSLWQFLFPGASLNVYLHMSLLEPSVVSVVSNSNGSYEQDVRVSQSPMS